MKKLRPAKAGFVCFGEINTPKDIIKKKCVDAKSILKIAGIEVIATAPVCDDSAGAEAARAVQELKNKEFDLLIVCIAGWIPSWAVFEVTEHFKHLPMLLWGLTGWQRGDRFVTTADQAGTSALRKPMADMGYNFKYVVNFRGQDAPLDEIISFAEAARTVKMLKTAKIGMMGYRDMRLYGTLYDGVSLKGKIGPEIEHFEMLEIEQMMQDVSDAEIDIVSKEVLMKWQFTKDPRPQTVHQTVRLFLALKKKIEECGYSAFSFVDVNGIKKLMQFAPAGALTLLHEKMDICTIPENDSMGAVTQLMTYFLTGQVAAYLEFYEFMENGALMGVPDYVPDEIVDGNIKVMPNSFGGFGEGLLNVSTLKTGKVTIARLTYTGNKYSLHLITGTAKPPRKWEEAGWAPPVPQLPSLEIEFDGNTGNFIQNVMGQHYIISYGDNRKRMEDLCNLLGIKVIS
ncbi:MAG: hypothetical protein ABIK53_02760 [bacterium]